MTKRCGKKQNILVMLLLSIVLLLPFQSMTAYAAESEEVVNFDTEIFEQMLNEYTAANEALLKALPDFIEFVESFQFHDMTLQTLDEATTTQEEVEADFKPEANVEVYEFENGETTLSYEYEVGEDIALLEVSFSEGYLLYVDLLAYTMSEQEINITNYEELEEAKTIEDLTQLDLTTIGIGAMNIAGIKPILAIPSTMPNEVDSLVEENESFAESYILFEDNSIRYSRAQNVNGYLINTVEGMVGLLQAYMDSL